LQKLGGGVIEGFVDLTFEDASGDLTIVDYKTDRLPKGASLERSARPYRLQVGAYAHAVETATGRRVTSAWIVFARRAADGLPAAYRLPDLDGAKRQAASAALEATAVGLHGSSGR
jgi:RecB family exonuclease